MVLAIGLERGRMLSQGAELQRSLTRLFIPVALGAILFLASDVLLAIWIFHDITYRPFDLVWLSYGLGQMLIVCGTSGFIRRIQT